MLHSIDCRRLGGEDEAPGDLLFPYRLPETLQSEESRIMVTTPHFFCLVPPFQQLDMPFV